jgi:hypothetical protein
VQGFDLMIKDNSATVGAGIWNALGDVRLSDSTIRHNTGAVGAGIFNAVAASTVLERCTVMDNLSTVGAGGGILNSGVLSLANTTVSGNRAKLGGGGIHNDGHLAINFSTITANSANFDLSGNLDPAAVGGGIGNLLGGTVTMANTILAGNFDGRDTPLPAPPELVSPDCYSPPVLTAARAFLSERDNLVGAIAANCNIKDRDPSVTGTPFDTIGSTSLGNSVDPGLGPLADNGGFTLTHALEPGSPAIDADRDQSAVLTFRCPRTDQRGLRRPGDDAGDATCDVGAYEAGGRTAVPTDQATGESPVTVTFSNVVQPGVTQLEIRSTGPNPPAGFMLGSPPLFYELSTTTTFTPPVTVCIDYSGTSFQNLSTLRLFHFEDTDGDGTADTWVDRTILPVDTVNKVICARVDSFSLFAVLEHVNRPPVADAGPDQQLECGGGPGTTATLDASSSFDPDGDAMQFKWKDANGEVVGNTSRVSVPVTMGAQLFTVRVDDGRGGSAVDSVTVTVGDSAPPVVTGAAASPDVLWPANNKMVPVTVSASATDGCDSAPSCRIVSVRSNEAGESSGRTDWEIVGELALNLRAARLGHGPGRVYTITLECRDASGNAATANVTVTVPHDQRRR